MSAARKRAYPGHSHNNRCSACFLVPSFCALLSACTAALEDGTRHPLSEYVKNQLRAAIATAEGNGNEQDDG